MTQGIIAVKRLCTFSMTEQECKALRDHKTTVRVGANARKFARVRIFKFN